MWGWKTMSGALNGPDAEREELREFAQTVKDALSRGDHLSALQAAFRFYGDGALVMGWYENGVETCLKAANHCLDKLKLGDFEREEALLLDEKTD